MHKYLRSVGFSDIKRRKELHLLLLDVIEHYDRKIETDNYSDGKFTEFTKYYGQDFGVSVCGSVDESGQIHVDYYYPFLYGDDTTTMELVTIERHAEKDSFAGSCDDLRIGVTLIFYLQNPGKYISEHGIEEGELKKGTGLCLTALGKEGMILLPLEKDKAAVMGEKEQSKKKSDLLAAARDGDEEAMESLTMEDMDTYSMISERIMTDDVLTIVDSYFMPHGIECDQYNILGEILDYQYCNNVVTDEEICLMTLESNDMQYKICINKKDLLGEPDVGRRFKGVILLQGRILEDDEVKPFS